MQSFISCRIVVVFLLLLSIQASAAKAKDFSGQWETTYGLMTLEQKGVSVSGQYIMGGERCSIEGKVQNRRLDFKYREPNASGEGWFELDAGGDRFSGSWRENGSSVWMPWVGTRTTDLRKTFAGVWETSFGRMRLIENEDGEVRGIYSFEGVSTLSGKKNNDRLTLRYHEKNVSGEAWFQLKDEGSINLKALHFSSCSVMKDKFGKEVFNALADAGIKTAVSGYQNPSIGRRAP